MTEPFIHASAPPPGSIEGWWFAFQGGRMLVRDRNDDGMVLPRAASATELGLEPARTLYLGQLHGEHCFAAEIADEQSAPSGMQWQGLRALYFHFDEHLIGVASRAFHVIDWDRTHQFCGRCGTRTVPRASERARTCPNCRLTSYPKICPAMMVLITRGREVLLGRKASMPKGRYSALAGFVEGGESIEQTVVREAREEVGVEVTNLRYFRSQSWPFPNSLMIAFTAEYAGGEITPDGVEIEDARWFDVEELPILPDGISVSRWMIDATAAELADRFPRR